MFFAKFVQKFLKQRNFSTVCSNNSLSNLFKTQISLYSLSNKNYFGKNYNSRFFHENEICEKVEEDKCGIGFELNYILNKKLNRLGYYSYLVQCEEPIDSALHKNHVGVICWDNGRQYYLDVGFGKYFVSPLVLPLEKNTGVFYLTKKSACNSSLEILYENAEIKPLLKIYDKRLNILEVQKFYDLSFNVTKGDYCVHTKLYNIKFDISTNSYIQVQI